MAFDVLLMLALAACGVGLLLRAARWAAGGVTIRDRDIGPAARLVPLASATARTLFGPKLAAVLKGLVLDGLLQLRLYRADRLRWLAHMLIFWGFVPLLVLHAMDGVITAKLFPDYVPTLNPWQVLLNVFGAMVLAGVGLAVWRRVTQPSRVPTTAMDVLTLAAVAAIVLTGFVLDGAKIASQSDFARMVEEYGGYEDPAEVAALEAFWVEDYGLAASDPAATPTPEQLELGRQLNTDSCAFCHSRPQAAAGSYAVSRLLAPVSCDPQSGLTTLAYWLHVGVFFAFLAWLPFGKMRHAITSPLSLIADRCARARNGRKGIGQHPFPALRAVRRMLDLDACTRCGLCSERCSVGLCAEVMGNRYILPSEKLAALDGSSLESVEDARALLEGLTVCTTCLRCTDVCPVGINLQDLWDAVREDMLGHGAVDVFNLSPLGLHRAAAFPESFAATQDALEAAPARAFAQAADREVQIAGRFGGGLSDGGDAAHVAGMADDGAFRFCFSCKTCTSSCPIVGLAELGELGLAPHQIIHATALGLDDLVASSRMLWSCLGCYRCQDSCPQGVRVTDVFYAQKNKALARMKTMPAPREA